MQPERERQEPNPAQVSDVPARPGEVPFHRRVVVKLSLMLALMVLIASWGALITYELTTSDHELVDEVAEIARLRMLTQKISLEAVRPLATTGERFAAVNAAAREFERLLDRFRQPGNELAEMYRESERVRIAFDALQPEWERLRDLALGVAYKGMLDPAFEIASGTLLTRTELLVAALKEVNTERHRRLVAALGVAAAASVLLLALFWQSVHRVVIVPINALLRASQRLAQGDLGVRVVAAGDDEIGLLGHAFNDAGRRIEQMLRRSIEQERLLAASELRHRLISETSPDAIIMIDAANTIHYANSAVTTVFGHAPEELIGRDIGVLQPERLRRAHKAGFARYLESGVRSLDWHRVETQALTRAGGEIEVEIAFTRIEFDDGPHFAAYFRDVTARKKAEAQLLLQDRALASSDNGIVILRVAKAGQSAIVYVNPAFERISGRAAQEILGGNGACLLPEDLDPIEVEEVRSALRERRAARVVLRNRRKDGSLFWNEILLSPVTDAAGEDMHFIAVTNDVSERIEREAALQYNATHDDLTKLPNRALLLDRLAQAIAVAERRHGQLAVLFLDLDHFKYVNDSHGHVSGDQLLKEVAARILLVLREGDTVARLGGDEFVLLLDDIKDEMDVSLVGERLLESFHGEIRLDCGRVFVSASIGAAIYPRDGDTPDMLLKNADIAMYRAKEQGRANLQFFTHELQARVQQRISIETALHQALEQGEFELHFQPKAVLADGRLCGGEALIRWRSPVRGLVYPNEFIPVAEDTGLIVPIGEWVIDAACAAARRWRDAGLGFASQGAFPVAINLSARQFRERDLAQRVEAALARHGLAPEALELEVTESMTMHNPDEAIRIMQRLKERGLRLAMDDFGTGYSSLAYLKRFPIDILKIDRSFIRDIPEDGDDRMIAGAIVSLAHNLGLEVVAEGVETIAQLNFLRQLGCNMIQGYVLARPLPLDDFERLAAAGASLPPFDAKATEAPLIRIVKTSQ